MYEGTSAFNPNSTYTIQLGTSVDRLDFVGVNASGTSTGNTVPYGAAAVNTEAQMITVDFPTKVNKIQFTVSPRYNTDQSVMITAHGYIV